MSIPAIASATGASVGTVHGDLSTLKGSGAELPTSVTGLDGKSRPATITTRTTETTEVVDLATGEILSEDVTAEVWEAEQAVREFPALNVPGSDPADIVAMAANLRALPEDQRAWRAENGRKWLTAKVEGRIGQRRPETPDIWAPVFKAVTECIRTIRDAGGPEALVAALDGLLPIHRDNNLGQVADLAATLDDIRPQGLRRIQ